MFDAPLLGYSPPMDHDAHLPLRLPLECVICGGARKYASSQVQVQAHVLPYQILHTRK